MDGRPSVGVKDVQELAVPVMRHRIAPDFQAQADGIDSVEIVRKLLEVVPRPQVAREA